MFSWLGFVLKFILSKCKEILQSFENFFVFEKLQNLLENSLHTLFINFSQIARIPQINSIAKRLDSWDLSNLWEIVSVFKSVW